MTSILWGFEQNNQFFEGWTWFSFNNLGLAVGMDLQYHTSVMKGLKINVTKFWELILTFVLVAGEKLVEEVFLLPHLE